MAKGFQRKLPMSAALRQGGEGVVNPQDVKTGDVFGTKGIEAPATTPAPSGPTTIGKGVKAPKPPSPPKLPAAPKSLRPPAAPKMPKFK